MATNWMIEGAPASRRMRVRPVNRVRVRREGGHLALLPAAQANAARPPLKFAAGGLRVS